MKIDTRRAEFFINVYKDGALSRLGHDLRLQCRQFRFQADDAHALEATFDLGSIVVLGAVRDGVIEPHELSAKDRKDILKNMSAAVLETERHPTAVFRSASVLEVGPGFRVTGQLTLHGVKRELQFDVEVASGHASAEVLLKLTDFDMRPYKALMGALKTKNEVLVEVRVPFDR